MEGAAGVGPNGGSEVGLGVGIGGIISEAQRPPVQLDLLPLAPPLRALHSHLSFSRCLTEYGKGKCCDGEARSSVSVSPRGFDVNQKLIDDDARTLLSSPNTNSTVSSFQMGVDFSVHPGGRGGRGSSMERINDEDEVGTARKKFRLSKEQSAYLGESFKEHSSSTLYPKQKLALARQLNLCPRQIEVWLQNRKARTKLKQTEVEYKYLKRCCETLTGENRGIQKEIQELRHLKVEHPFYMQLSPAILTMCPSCERVAKTTNDNKTPLKSFPSALAQVLPLPPPL